MGAIGVLMIDDPIIFKSISELQDHCNRSDGPQFCLTVNGDGSQRLHYVSCDQSQYWETIFLMAGGKHFAFGRVGEGTSKVPWQTVSKSECIDLIMAHYPDHFEWLLWHPEWL